MITQVAEKYQRALCLNEEATRPPSEAEMQAVWFESLIKPRLQTDLDTMVTVIQPGIWNRAEGPDFLQAALRDAEGRTLTGAVELHLRAPDWVTHGHHQDPRYEHTLLHGVWFRPSQPFFPATNQFRRVTQTIFSEQLVAPWSELCHALEPLHPDGRPLAQPGICQRELAGAPPERIVEILRSAGAWRFRRKAERLRWRLLIRGRIQGLWESLAESLGYAHNKIPMRLLAQRIPVSWSELKPPVRRSALLYGLAGFLPGENLSPCSEETRMFLRPLWDQWWKERDRLDYAMLPRSLWNLASLRPNNRPERRICALSALYPYLAKLAKCVQAADARLFGKILSSLDDPFWSHHTTWRSKPSSSPLQLIGDERIADILLNIFWPLASLENETRAYEAIRQMTSIPNRQTRIARERVLGSIPLGRAWRESLVQQGLLQIYQDFCLNDATACLHCPFPNLVRNF